MFAAGARPAGGLAAAPQEDGGEGAAEVIVDMCKEKLMQAAGRMRKLDRGQKLLFAVPPEPARALRPPFDSHYVCIAKEAQEPGGANYQCGDGMRYASAMPDYDELILNDGAQLLPAYKLYFRATDTTGTGPGGTE